MIDCKDLSPKQHAVSGGSQAIGQIRYQVVVILWRQLN